MSLALEPDPVFSIQHYKESLSVASNNTYE
jgi:hypothetical protein